ASTRRRSSLFPYPSLFRSQPPVVGDGAAHEGADVVVPEGLEREQERAGEQGRVHGEARVLGGRRDERDPAVLDARQERVLLGLGDRKSTRLNSSHVKITYA